MISKTVLVLAGGFGASLNATRVAEAIGRGLRAADERLRCDLCPLETHTDEPGATRARAQDGRSSETSTALDRVSTRAQPPQSRSERSNAASTALDQLDFDRRMRAARAIVIARERLDDRTLAGSVAFEAATRARQSGVPAYAVCAHDGLDPFEARVVDLQVILQASTPRALNAAGRRLAGLV